MNINDDIDYLNPVQTTISGDNDQGLTESLLPYFNLKSLPVGMGWSKIGCLYESKVLAAVREAYMDELVQS